MSKDFNQCSFIGRLGRDPESAVTKTGTDISKFSIACGDDYKDKQGNKVERTNWIPVVTMGGLAKVCSQWLSKGSQVLISGKLVSNKWQDKEGNNRVSYEIMANDMQMLGGQSKQNQEPHNGGQPAQYGQDFDTDSFSDSIPF